MTRDCFYNLRIYIDTHTANQTIGEFEHLCEFNPIFDPVCIASRTLEFCDSGITFYND